MDDDEDHVRLIEILLGGDGYTVQSAGSGGAAMRSVAERAPDVILLDIGLPDLNGYQVCRRLKADATTRLIPVVFLSGLDVFEARMAAIKAGAQEFLSKPFDCEELRARVRSLVRLKHQTDELESAESVIMSLGADCRSAR